LEREKVDCIKAMQWERFDQINIEQANVGKPCFIFLHAYEEDTPPKPLILHPQLLCDGKGIVEFGELFFQYWHQKSDAEK
jgi:hypothetical protein